MEYSKKEIDEYIRQVVNETKRTAHVDTGFLKRSIRGNYFKGMVTFREVFYGAYNGNARLLENALRIMPKDILWQVIFVDEDGRATTIKGETRTGRTITRKSIGNTGKQTTSKIRSLINYIRNRGEKKDSTADAD